MKFSLNAALTAVAVIAAVMLGYLILTKQPATPSPAGQNTYTAAAADQPAASVTYTDQKYGFDITLPASWKGYSVLTDEWIGNTVDKNGETPSEKGPLISIRHPLWTANAPRQNIPVMVFTLDQWNALQKSKFHIGAAPINPMELDRNAKYVFALPARYNYAFMTGYDEVAIIMAKKALKAF